MGVFGKLAAYGVAVEEQGRKTLHAHILIYILGWNQTLSHLHSDNEHLRNKAMQEVIKFVDSCISTELQPGCSNELLCFQCKQQNLTFLTPQELRCLRHKEGCKVHHGILACCGQCGAKFRGNDVALKKVLPSLDTSVLSDEEIAAYVSYHVLGNTIPTSPTQSTPQSIGLVNYKFNHHADQHTKTCFKKGIECRMNLPDIPESQTQVLLSTKKYEVFKWNGETTFQHNVTIRPKRLQHDAFTNSYHNVMSACRAPCNSNIGVTTGARATVYASCYTAKGTQKEDTAEYIRMASYVGNRFQHQQKETALFENLSRLMGAVIVATGEHVCAAPMAAYLVRHQSRFRFSVNFKYIPIRELASILDNETDHTNMTMAVLGHESGCFLTNEALHYLQRPKCLENKCVVDFFQEYEVIRKNHTSSTQETFEFDDEDHPGFSKQILRKWHPSNPALAQFSHWSFPDAASFGGNIFNLFGSQINSAVQKLCQTVLILYHPFRSLSDLTVDGSYHQKFITLFPTKYLPPHIETVLDNVQMFYNSMHLPAREDPLSETTVPFSSTSTSASHTPDEEDDPDDTFLEGLFGFLDPSTIQGPSDPKYSLFGLRKAGARHCGFEHLPTHFPTSSDTSSFQHPPPVGAFQPHIPFISNLPTSFNTNLDNSSASAIHSQKRDNPSLEALMKLTYPSSRRRLEENGTFTSTPLVDADGTASSIIEWSQQPHLNFDSVQMLAFQIVTAAFVLTYFDGVQDINNAHEHRHNYNQERKALCTLARLSNRKPQLRMFLDGPAGSGKSHVVKTLLQYAQLYTTNLGVTFDMRTIVVTAMSGVAATSIGGETLHSAAALNRNIDEEQDNSWINARLLIIDECSFMDVAQEANLDAKLRTLMHRHTAIYGGLHVLFCGDFRQLEPIAGTPLYSSNPTDKNWVNSINCYLELQGLHRFQSDPEWGMILRRIRNATPPTPTQQDLDAINACVIGNRNIPSDASYCVYSNCDRSAINTGIFSNLLQYHSKPFPLLPDNILVVRGSDMQRVLKNGTRVDLQPEDIHYIFEHCGDHQVSTSGRGNKGHFVDPLLKLYLHIPLMFTSNDDVPNGHANGTRVLLLSVVLKPLTSLDSISIDDHQCHSVEANSIEYIVCCLDGNPDKLFHVHPKSTTVRVKAPLPNHFGATSATTINFKIVMTQLPLLVNNATTGHKLQGQTKRNLVISVWSKKRNWNYVALSRVTTRAGLFLVSPLPHDVDFSISPDLTQMLHSLKQKRPQLID